MPRAELLASVFVAAILCAPLVRAEGTNAVEGTVVALESDDVVVDLAGQRGAATGDVVELWRPLKLKHPVTGKIISDRFRIGTLRLTQVRDALALARPEGKLARPAAAGDVVILRKEAPANPAALPKEIAARRRAPSRERDR